MAHRIVISEALLSAVEEMRTQAYAPKTIERYAWCIKNFGEFLQGQGIDDLRGVTRAHVESYQETLRRRRWAASTCAQTVQAVGRLFATLVERGELLIDPTERVQRLRRGRVVRRVPSEREVERMLAACNTSLRPGIRLRAIVEVLYGSAIRVGELCSLTVHDVDLDHGLLRVPRGKGNKGRVVPMGANCKTWLREYLEKVRPWWARRKLDERRLFLTRSARPMDGNAVRQELMRLCQAAGVKQTSPHALHHAAATHMVRAGCDIRYVQKLLGHKNLSTTQTYTQVSLLDVQATHKKTHPREQVS